MFLSVFFFRNSLQFKKVSLPLQPQTRNNGAIAQLVEQRTENPCVPGSIPGGTTFTKRKIMKTAEIQLFQRFFIYVLSAKICNLGFSRFFVGIIFYLREVLLTLHYEKRLFEHASQPRVAGSDIRLLSHLWSRTNLSRDSYQSG